MFRSSLSAAIERNPLLYELIEQALAADGYAVGSTTGEGLWAAGRQLSNKDSTVPFRMREFLQDPRVEALVLDTLIEIMVEKGLAIDTCDVAIVGAVRAGSPDELPAASIQALEMLAHLAQRAVVIDIDHPLRGKLTEQLDVQNITLVSMRPETADHEQHISHGGTAIVLDEKANHQRSI
jgi:hypothetical protein